MIIDKWGIIKIQGRLDKIEKTLEDMVGDKPIQGDREQDYLDKIDSPHGTWRTGPNNIPPIEEVIKDYGKTIMFSKSFMMGILKQCDVDDCDGVEIVIYKHGKRVRSYEYDKTI